MPKNCLEPGSKLINTCLHSTYGKICFLELFLILGFSIGTVLDGLAYYDFKSNNWDIVDASGQQPVSTFGYKAFLSLIS